MMKSEESKILKYLFPLSHLLYVLTHLYFPGNASKMHMCSPVLFTHEHVDKWEEPLLKIPHVQKLPILDLRGDFLEE